MKTTRGDFRAFKKRVKEVLEMYGISHINLWFEHNADDETRAQCCFAMESQQAAVRLSKHMDGRSRKEVRKLVLDSATHEAHHLVLGELYNLARRRHVMEEDLERAEHTAVRRLDRFVKKYAKIKRRGIKQ